MYDTKYQFLQGSTLGGGNRVSITASSRASFINKNTHQYWIRGIISPATDPYRILYNFI